MLDDLEEMKQIARKHKTSQRKLSAATGISQSTISRRVRVGMLKKSRVHMLPFLTNKQRIERIQFCLEHLQEPFCSDTLDRRFKLQLNEIHLDEKLFYVTIEKEDYYQHNLEDVPVKKGISKRFITCCMFLAVCARPRYDPHSKTFGMGR